MAMKLTKADHQQMNAMIDSILTSVVMTQATPQQAREAIAHVITAAAIGNEAEVRNWLAGDRLERWKQLCIAAKH